MLGNLLWSWSKGRVRQGRRLINDYHDNQIIFVLGVMTIKMMMTIKSIMTISRQSYYNTEMVKNLHLWKTREVCIWSLSRAVVSWKIPSYISTWKSLSSTDQKLVNISLTQHDKSHCHITTLTDQKQTMLTKKFSPDLLDIENAKFSSSWGWYYQNWN